MRSRRKHTTLVVADCMMPAKQQAPVDNGSRPPTGSPHHASVDECNGSTLTGDPPATVCLEACNGADQNQAVVSEDQLETFVSC
ncbi:hypothetical protein CEK25_012836 [Fusarium fujikuroi]|nr:hypothetical protein CEK25_012836 [Fusarium fujikuroi]